MAGSRLFRPNEGLDVPSPSDTKQNVGNIVNPPNFAEFGGLSSPNLRGLKRNDKTISMPASTIRPVPQRNTK
jgi:hypothetical protein